jgi:hypothetical protein
VEAPPPNTDSPIFTSFPSFQYRENGRSKGGQAAAKGKKVIARKEGASRKAKTVRTAADG